MMQQSDALLFNQGDNPQARACMLQYSAVTNLLPLLLSCCFAARSTHHLQDIMRLDNSARMNTPGKAAGNWAWRVGGPDVWEKLAEETKQLKQLAYVFDRMPKGTKEIDY
jgi:4-alpha-glucanotransferase